jgi:hypothetical protein
MSRIIMFDQENEGPHEFTTSRFNSEGIAEKTIQELVFDHPGLIPIDAIDPGAVALVPLCRELTLRGAAGPVYLDMIGVTRRGRLVLVECKLWRNPQARREVIGQILEYAALVGKLSYGNLSALVAQKTGRRSSNILWEMARDRLGVQDEAAFVDAVSASLHNADFDLVILGDGIRGEVEVVRGYLEAAGLRSRLFLIEVNCWRDDAGRTLYVPRVALTTRVIEHRVGASSSSSSSLQDLSPMEAPEPSQQAKAARMDNRSFWQQFIDKAQFTHPDQPPPTHGGNNWVRLPLPVTPAVAYRALGEHGPNTRLGFYVRFSGEDGLATFEALRAQLPELEAELGLPLRAEWIAARNGWDIAMDAPSSLASEDAAQLQWLIAQADPLVNALRPRLAQLANGPGDDAQ